MKNSFRNNFLFSCIILSFFSFSQLKREDVLRRYQYLNFNSSLDNLVRIDDFGIKIFSSLSNKQKGNSEFDLSWNEGLTFLNLIDSFSLDTMIKIYETKNIGGCKKYWKNNYSKKHIKSTQVNSIGKLAGKKIAIDPGHIAGDLATGKIERKFLEFRPNDTTKLKEEVEIVEGKLTWETAFILKSLLEKEGATVFLTRKKESYTAFSSSYEDWLLKRKKKVLDSLMLSKKITIVDYKNLIKCDKEKFFLSFFKDHDLAQRITEINKFKPDLSIIIHYNVDEKNIDWLKPGPKNFTMCFIGGGMTPDNFKKTSYKLNFLRLLLSNHLDASEKIAGLTVQEFFKQLKIPIAKKTDALYLAENCNESKTAGVYCRNLALCRAIASPLVYGEALYQDNFDECQHLCKLDKDYLGLKTNQRIIEVANCYYDAIIKYFK